MKFIQIVMLLLSMQFLHCNGEEKVLKVSNVEIWSETFGKQTDPAILLIMAAGGQGVMWPTAFCERLASQGFYVIRYDHRDMGLSTSINYSENPYDLMDLARDAIGVLDALAVQNAHLVGLSMGGSLAAILGKEFSHRVQTLTMINSTSDLSTFLDPSEANPTLLPKPQKKYLAWVNERDAILKQGVAFDEKVRLFLKSWEILNGSEAVFDEKLYQGLMIQTLQRSKNPQGFSNHTLAMKASLDFLRSIFKDLPVPALIIHGTASPIFSKEHALDLASKIPNARLEFIEGMGHILNPLFYEKLEQLIVSHAQSRNPALRGNDRTLRLSEPQNDER